MDPNADPAARLASRLATIAHFSRGCLHIDGGAYAFPAVLRIRIRTPENRQNCVPDELVDRAVISKDAVCQNCKVFIEQRDNFLRRHRSRKTDKSANIST